MDVVGGGGVQVDIIVLPYNELGIEKMPQKYFIIHQSKESTIQQYTKHNSTLSTNERIIPRSVNTMQKTTSKYLFKVHYNSTKFLKLHYQLDDNDKRTQFTETIDNQECCVILSRAITWPLHSESNIPGSMK